MRKVSKWMLIFGMAFLMMNYQDTVSAQEELTVEEKAVALHELALFDGVSAESFEPDLEGVCNREQAMKVLLMSMGVEVDYTIISEFEDVSDWAQPYVATSVEVQISNGISTDIFGADNTITSRQLHTWIDRYLEGSESAWLDNEGYDNTKPINRGDMVNIIFDALKRIPVNSEQSIITTIVGEDQSKIKVAQMYGLIEQNDNISQENISEEQAKEKIETSDATTQPENSSVSADDDFKINAISVVNNSQIKVTFTQELDVEEAVEDINYGIYENGNILSVISSISIENDQTVVINFSKSLDGRFALFVNGKIGEEGGQISDVKLFDLGTYGIPEMTNISVMDDKRIVVKFSEAIDEATATEDDSYMLLDDDGAYQNYLIDNIEMTNDDEVTITFEDRTRGKFTLVVEDVKCSTRNKLFSGERSFEISNNSDTTAPEIESITVLSSREIQVTYNDEMDQSEVEERDFYTLMDSDGEEVAHIISDIDMVGTNEDTVVIEFRQELSGTYTLYVDGAEDTSGNVAKDHKSFQTDDYELTMIDGGRVYSYNCIKIEFTNELGQNASEPSYYSIYDEAGILVDVEIVDIIVSDDSVILTLDIELEKYDYYTFKVNGVDDVYGHEINDEIVFKMKY